MNIVTMFHLFMINLVILGYFLLLSNMTFTLLFLALNNLLRIYYPPNLRVFRSDKGGEYSGHSLKTFFDTNGIIHQRSCPHTPEQNGIVECKHHHIIEMTLTLLSNSGVPLRFWFHAFACVVFLINRLPSPSLNNQSPFAILFSSSPYYSHLRVCMLSFSSPLCFL